MKGVDFIEKDFGLKRIIASDIATHNQGGNLDGIWTNMATTACVLHDGLSDITDHSLIEVSLLIDETVSRQLPQSTEEFVAQADIRRAQSKLKDIKEALLEDDSLDRSMKDLIRD